MEKNVADRPKTAAEFCEIMGTPLGATATRRVTSRHTARHRVPTGARMPAYTPTDEMEIPKPVPLYKKPLVVASGALAVVAAGWVAFLSLNGSSASAAGGDRTFDPTTVAVMYFDDQTGGKLGHIADGITETLIDQLKLVSGLEILSKDAVGRFRGSQPTIDTIAKTFDAGTIVIGSVSENGDRASITFDIRDGTSEASVKRLGLELPQADVFNLNKTVVDSVAYYLRDAVGKEVKTRALVSGTNNQRAISEVQLAEKLRKDAVAAVTRGDSTAAWNAFARADTALSRAEQLDGKWVAPIAMRAGVALAEANAAKTPLLKGPYVDQGLAHAERALKVDPNDLDALQIRGQLRAAQWVLQKDNMADANKLLQSAQEDLDKVTSLDRTRARAWIALSSVQAQLRDIEGALISARTAYEADAFFSGVDATLRALYSTHYDREEFNQASKWCKEGFRRFPNDWLFVSCQMSMRWTNEYTTDIDSAWRELETLRSVVPENLRELQVRRHKMLVAATIARNGLRDSAIHVIESARTDDKSIDPNGQLLTFEALARVRLNTSPDTAEAFRLLQKYVVSQPSHAPGFLNRPHWWWKGLRNDARWETFLRRAAAS
jgi:TolB-like protein